MIPIELDTIYTGDSLEVLKTFPDDSIQCCVTSPPYYALRDYGMLVERDGRITGFKKEKYFNVHISNGAVTADLEKIKDIAEAKKIAGACSKKQASVSSVRKEKKTVNSPKLYDLTTLQREANRSFGYTAQQTLDLVQSMYEKKLLTYPRTDSQFLTDDMDERSE